MADVHCYHISYSDTFKWLVENGFYGLGDNGFDATIHIAARRAVCSFYHRIKLTLMQDLDLIDYILALGEDVNRAVQGYKGILTALN